MERRPLPRFVAIAALLAAFAGACRADMTEPARRCTLHRPLELAPGTHAHALMQDRPLHLLRVCTGWKSTIDYSVVSLPTHSSPGVCRFTEEVDRPGYPPETLAGVHSGSCPAPELKDYLRVDDVPDATLVQLVAFQREMASSDAAFDRALAGLDLAGLSDRQRYVDAFRRAVLAHRATLFAVHRPDVGAGPAGAFVLAWGDPADSAVVWRLAVEPVAGRTVVRGFDAGILD